MAGPGVARTLGPLAAVRDEVNLALEEKRQEKVIKANLSAQVSIGRRGEALTCCRSTRTSCRRCSACRR